MKQTKVNKTKAPAFRIELSSGFILFFALIWFFDEGGFLAALIPAILVHELGHMMFLLFFGAHPTRLKTALPGFVIDYSGTLTEMQETLAALAGPALGLLFSYLCARLGKYWDNSYLLLCSGIGFILNFFNFLPVEPLDGGRVLGFALRSLCGEEKARRMLSAVALITALAVIAMGLYYIKSGIGPALFLAGVWLFILQRRNLSKR